MITFTDIFATGPVPACARPVVMSGNGSRVVADRPWTPLTHKHPARHLGEVSM